MDIKLDLCGTDATRYLKFGIDTLVPMMFPIMLYDDRCVSCTRFAKIVDTLAQGRLTIIGHYSEQGRRIRDMMLDQTATDMFWIVDRREAFGGRAALLPLLRAIFTARGGLGMISEDNDCYTDTCHVLVRSASLLRCSGHITYDIPSESLPDI